MALISGIFESNLNEDGTYDRAVDEEFFARYHAAFLSSGVYPKPANSFQVTADGGLRLRVKPGSCLIQGYYAYDTADALLSLPAAGISARTDRVVARLNKIDRRIEIAVVNGGANAPAPTRNSDVYELVLANVRVAANAAAVTQANITDQRANSSLCGFAAIQSAAGSGYHRPVCPVRRGLPAVHGDGGGRFIRGYGGQPACKVNKAG
ncbi:MAG: hypothetical protein ACLSAP_08700 [Oscillospiraceae bacterium]